MRQTLTLLIYSSDFASTEEMHITQEVVYTLPTDGVVFSAVTGSENGRIFMGAKDGCLYEFIYQVRWVKLRRRTRKNLLRFSIY